MHNNNYGGGQNYQNYPQQGGSAGNSSSRGGSSGNYSQNQQQYQQYPQPGARPSDPQQQQSQVNPNNASNYSQHHQQQQQHSGSRQPYNPAQQGHPQQQQGHPQQQQQQQGQHLNNNANPPGGKPSAPRQSTAPPAPITPALFVPNHMLGYENDTKPLSLTTESYRIPPRFFAGSFRLRHARDYESLLNAAEEMYPKVMGYPGTTQEPPLSVPRDYIEGMGYPRYTNGSPTLPCVPVPNRKRVSNPYKRPCLNSTTAPLATAQHFKSNSTSNIWTTNSIQQPRLSDLIAATAITINAQLILTTFSSDGVAYQRMQQFDETTHTKQPVTQEQLIPPSVDTVLNFLTNVFDVGQFHPETCVVTLIYLNRFLSRTRVQLTALNWKSIYIIALVIAQKSWDDTPLINSDFGILYPVLNIQIINFLERIMLDSMEFDLIVTQSQFASYFLDLRLTLVQHRNPYLLHSLTMKDLVLPKQFFTFFANSGNPLAINGGAAFEQQPHNLLRPKSYAQMDAAAARQYQQNILTQQVGQGNKPNLPPGQQPALSGGPNTMGNPPAPGAPPAAVLPLGSNNAQNTTTTTTLPQIQIDSVRQNAHVLALPGHPFQMPYQKQVLQLFGQVATSTLCDFHTAVQRARVGVAPWSYIDRTASQRVHLSDYYTRRKQEYKKMVMTPELIDVTEKYRIVG